MVREEVAVLAQRKKRESGFTLVEIIIVVLIIGLLMMVATPQWLRARERSQARACVYNLRQIAAAKEQFAMENRLNNGDPVSMGDIWPIYIKMTTSPSCPVGGTYTVGPVGADPTCSFTGGLYPHQL